MPHVLIVCLGDVGRSPRMQYHATAFTHDNDSNKEEEPWTVELMGYEGSPCFPQILSNPSIRLHLFPSSSSSLTTIPSRLKRLALVPFKVLRQSLQLLSEMTFKVQKRPNLILVQNPPSIPTLILALIASYLHHAALIIDWHNFGYTLLGLNFGPSSPIVRLACSYERIVGQLADGHLCVTKEMKKWIKEEWNIDAHVLHDRSQSHFHQLSPTEHHDLFHSLLSKQGLLQSLNVWKESIDEMRLPQGKTREEYETEMGEDRTPFTYRSGEEVHFRSDRPTLIISSTSWTADEDFTILARAIQQYEREIARSRGESEATTTTGDDDIEDTDASILTQRGVSKKKKKSPTSTTDDSTSTSRTPLPRAVFLITGKGPLRDAFLASIASMSLVYCQVHCLFVSAEEYPLILGAADLGVSLHYSSSGLDLPMKVVDMFGTGLPVCAIRFKCISELVEDGVNGRLFGVDPLSGVVDSSSSSSSSPAASASDPSIELSSQLTQLFSPLTPEFACDPSKANDIELYRLRAGATAWARITWQQGWNTAVRPIITRQELDYHTQQKKANLKSILARIVSIILIVVGGLLMIL